MIIGEVGIMTRDVKQTADFYKWLLRIDNGSDDNEHQELISDGTVLTVCLEHGEAEIGHGGICLAFTVDNVDAEHERLISHGVTVLTPPTARPWGARNMSFLDPDGNTVYFRQFL